MRRFLSGADIASIIISLFVPSGGGHWAVQGPFAVPAEVRLHASLPATAMAVAIGEEVANMIQPFWALPILAIAGVGLRRVMAFTVVRLVIAFSFSVSRCCFWFRVSFKAPKAAWPEPCRCLRYTRFPRQ